MKTLQQEIVEALECIKEMVQMNGFGRAYAMDVVEIAYKNITNRRIRCYLIATRHGVLLQILLTWGKLFQRSHPNRHS